LAVVIGNPPSCDLGGPHPFSLVLSTISDPPSRNFDCGFLPPFFWL